MSRLSIPPSTRVIGDGGHVTDSNNVAKYLALERARKIYLDEYDNSGDDAKLAAAMTDANSGSYVVPIAINPRAHTLTSPLGQPFSGFSLEGPGYGVQSSAADKRNHQITVNTGGTAFITTSSNYYNLKMQGLYMLSTDNNTQFLRSVGAPALLWSSSLRDMSFKGYKGVFGTDSEPCAVDLIEFGGAWSVLSCYDTAFNLKGADCRALWTNGWLNIGSGDAGPSSGHGGGKYLMKFSGLSKSVCGNVYNTADNGWRGVQFSGSSGNGFGMVFRDSIVEGRNNGNSPTGPNTTLCDGNLIKVTGGQVTLRDNVVGFGMNSPSAGEHGLIEINGTDTDVIIDGLNVYTHANAQNVTSNGKGNGTGVPVVYVSGTPGQVAVRVRNVQASVRAGGASWGQLPIVQQTVSGLVVDYNPNEVQLVTGS